LYDIFKDGKRYNVGRVDQIYLSKLNQVQTIMNSRLNSVGLSSTQFSNVLSNKLRADSSNRPTLFPKGVDISKYRDGKNMEYIPAESMYTDMIEAIGKEKGLDPNLIKAVTRIESQFKKNALSSAGAQGLMQLMPGTAGDMGVTNTYDARQNIEGGTEYLKMQLERFGDLRLALAAYNCGPSRVAGYGITNPNDSNQYGRISERVQSYVDRVMKLYVKYSDQSKA
jgi:soluble lytic murein transglycosylase-like protein